jgi:hypothetical protein
MGLGLSGAISPIVPMMQRKIHGPNTGTVAAAILSLSTMEQIAQPLIHQLTL